MTMKKIIILILILIILLGGGFWLVQKGYLFNTYVPQPLYRPEANYPGLVGIFEGRVPCDDCEKIKIFLVLYQDPEKKTPTTYKLGRVYVGKGNDRTMTEGNWTILHGTKTNPNAIVYQLDQNTPVELGSYLAVDKNILLLLDKDMNPKVGNASWSYTLSRTR